MIKSAIEKAIDIISIPFKRLKVFYQILIISGIILLFLGVEGWMGFSTLNTMNKFSLEIFNNGIQLETEINNFQAKFDQLQVNYLKNIQVKGNFAEQGYSTVKPMLQDELKKLRKINPESTDGIKNEMATIDKILENSVSYDNYKELELTLNNIKYLCGTVMIDVRSTSLKSMDQGERFSNDTKFVTLLLMIIGIGLATLVSFVIAIQIANPLKSVGITANALAEGDLTKTIFTKGSIEVTKVIESLNKAINSLRKLVGHIDEQSTMLYKASQELKGASDETGKSATEIARTMGDLATAASDEATQISQVVENINSLADLVRQVSNEMKNISSDSESIAESANIGQKLSDDVSNEIVKIYDTTHELHTIISELDRDSEKIGEITSMIGGLAEQTTLLALNAAIEAARSGEHGKGFAVVAHETGKLAEQSKQAAQLIDELISQIKKRTTNAVNSITVGMTTVENGKSKATEAAVKFNNIFKKLENILDRIDSVALIAKNMAERNEDVISTVTNIAALSEESLASTEEVSATTEEQSASSQQVTALAENLAAISAELKYSISEFKID